VSNVIKFYLQTLSIAITWWCCSINKLVSIGQCCSASRITANKDDVIYWPPSCGRCLWETAVRTLCRPLWRGRGWFHPVPANDTHRITHTLIMHRAQIFRKWKTSKKFQTSEADMANGDLFVYRSPPGLIIFSSSATGLWRTDWLINQVNNLRPTRHKIGSFCIALPSQTLGLKQAKTKPIDTKQWRQNGQHKINTKHTKLCGLKHRKKTNQKLNWWIRCVCRSVCTTVVHNTEQFR